MEATAHASAPVLAAYRYCEAVTGQQARNFAYGIRLLPTDKRQAMSALYAFSRRVDDIGDGTLEPAAKHERLEDTRALLARVKDGRIDEDDTDPVAVALVRRRPPLPAAAGRSRRADRRRADGRARRELRDLGRAEGLLPLRRRCHRPALAGRVRHGARRAPDAERAAEYADTLGLALQLTNILRDVREDAGNGRTYLPAEDLAKFGCSAGFDALRTAAPAPTSPAWCTSR